MGEGISNKGSLVSIILPVYNGEKFLAQSIQSCIKQTYLNIELIIVNDCSTDSSLQIAEHFAQVDDRIKIISNEQNLNLPASLNIGHNLALGEYLTWTSDDNYYELNAIEEMVETLSKNGVDIVYSNFDLIDLKGISRPNKVMCKNINLLFGNNIGCCFLYKKEVFIKNKGYDETLHTIEDFDFWLQSKIHSQFIHIPSILYHYRIHDESLSSQLKSENPLGKEVFQKKLKISYAKFFKAYNLEKTEYSEIFKNFHLNQRIDVCKFLKNYQVFIEDFIPIFTQGNKREILKEIDLKLRANIYNHVENQSLKVLFQAIKTRPRILFGYDKKKSFKIIFRSLFNA